MCLLGLESTVPVTMEDMISMSKSVRRGAPLAARGQLPQRLRALRLPRLRVEANHAHLGMSKRSTSRVCGERRARRPPIRAAWNSGLRVTAYCS